MTILLAGDIGGTKTLLQVVSTSVAGAPVYKYRYSTPNFPNLESIVREFLTTVSERAGKSLVPTVACFGVAGPVANNRAVLTNVDWHLDGSDLAQGLGIAQVQLINDFSAVAYGIFRLQDTDIYCLQQGQKHPQGSIAILGAGTGMGQAYLTWTESGYQVHNSEGGHSSFAPINPLQVALLQFLWGIYPQVCVEQVLSGQGIVHIYEFLANYHQGRISPTLDLSQTADKAATIAQSVAIDRLADLTMELFVSAYGAEAGNLAMKILPTGGLYVAGGIAAQNLALLRQEQRFIKALLAKDKVAEILTTIPVSVILNPDVGLLGAVAQAERMAGSGINNELDDTPFPV